MRGQLLLHYVTSKSPIQPDRLVLILFYMSALIQVGAKSVNLVVKPATSVFIPASEDVPLGGTRPGPRGSALTFSLDLDVRKSRVGLSAST